MNAEQVIAELEAMAHEVSVKLGISYRAAEYRTDLPFTPRTAIKLNCGSRFMKKNVGVVITAIEAVSVDESQAGTYDPTKVQALLAHMMTSAYWSPVYHELRMLEEEQIEDIRSQLLREVADIRAVQRLDSQQLYTSRTVTLPVSSLEMVQQLLGIPDQALGSVLAYLMPTILTEWQYLRDSGLEKHEAAVLLRSRVVKHLYDDIALQIRFPDQ